MIGRSIRWVGAAGSRLEPIFSPLNNVKKGRRHFRALFPGISHMPPTFILFNDTCSGYMVFALAWPKVLSDLDLSQAKL
jgi:hypothetical protein